MLGLDISEIDMVGPWTTMLLFVRMSAVLYSLPGIGTQMVPAALRASFGLAIAIGLAVSGQHAPSPESFTQGISMMISEFALGYILGMVPSLILSGVAVAGQIIAGVIGLAQASMIDPSLNTNSAVLAHIQSMFATIVFLACNGHHAIIRFAALVNDSAPIGSFHPDAHTAAMLTDYFESSFALSLSLSAPVLAATLLSQFVMGLITRFIPQVNIFIISLPLTIIMGLFVIIYTFPRFLELLEYEFIDIGERAGAIFLSAMGG